MGEFNIDNYLEPEDRQRILKEERDNLARGHFVNSTSKELEIAAADNDAQKLSAIAEKFDAQISDAEAKLKATDTKYDAILAEVADKVAAAELAAAEDVKP